MTRNGLFPAAFWLLALNWTLVALVSREEARPALYAIRLLAFALIPLGIADKNRAGRSSGLQHSFWCFE
jgi:hypothetical protein